jgi:hypothetical protein
MSKKLIAIILLLCSISCAACPAAGADPASIAPPASIAVLPSPGETITAKQLLQLAVMDGTRPALVAKLRKQLPDKLFVSDGCSGGCPQRWRGVNLYPYCFWHDGWYFAGGTRLEKLRADARLMMDVAESTEDPDWAVVMFNSVWLGGNLPASWQWGKVGIEKK